MLFFFKLMEIYIDKEDQKIIKNYKGSLKNLLKDLKINAGTVIVVRDANLITEDTILNNTDKIKILSVVSGG